MAGFAPSGPEDRDRFGSSLASLGVLLHMNRGRLEEALGLAAKHLKPDGSFFAIAAIGDYTEGEWQGFPVLTQPLEFYANEAEQFSLEVSSLGTLDSLGYGRQHGKPSMDEMLNFRISG